MRTASCSRAPGTPLGIALAAGIALALANGSAWAQGAGEEPPSAPSASPPTASFDLDWEQAPAPDAPPAPPAPSAPAADAAAPPAANAPEAPPVAGAAASPAPPASAPSASAPPASAPLASAPPASAPPTSAPPGARGSLDSPDPPEASGPRPPYRLEHVRYHDPQVDRLFLYPSAETQPAGTFVFSAYEVVFWRFGYAPTDSLEVSFTTFLPVGVEEIYAAGDLSAKLRVLSRPRGAVAVTGGLGLTSTPMKSSWAPGPGGFARLGAVGQLCLDSRCFSQLALGMHALVFEPNTAEVDYYSPYSGGVFSITDGVALVLEPSLLVAVDGSEHATGALINYGLRLRGDRVGFDLGFARPVGEGAESYVLPMGLPFAVLSARSFGDAVRATRPPRPKHPWHPGPSPKPYPGAR